MINFGSTIARHTGAFSCVTKLPRVLSRQSHYLFKPQFGSQNFHQTRNFSTRNVTHGASTMNHSKKFIYGGVFISVVALTAFGFKAKNALSNEDICDTSLNYTPNYQYSLPEKILNSFLTGVAFDNKVPYTPEEIEKYKNALRTLHKETLSQNPSKGKEVVITAGAPGAGKTTLLEQYMVNARRDGTVFAYTDPDAVYLKHLLQTENYGTDKEARAMAYTKLRPITNWMAHVAVATYVRQNLKFGHGTTASAPQTAFYFKFLQDKGREITLLHISAPDQVRWDSIKKRDETFVQTTEQDTREKGLLVPQRINDTYLKFAKRIEFYYRDAVDSNAVLGGVWIRNADGTGGSITVTNPEAFAKLKEIQNAASTVLKQPEISWEQSVAKSVSDSW